MKTFAQFKTEYLKSICKEYNCKLSEAQDCYGDYELQKLWRDDLLKSKRNDLSKHVLKSYVNTFGAASFLSTFRGHREQHNLISL